MKKAKKRAGKKRSVKHGGGEVIDFPTKMIWGISLIRDQTESLIEAGLIDEDGQQKDEEIERVMRGESGFDGEVDMWKVSYVPNLERSKAPLYCSEDAEALGITIKTTLINVASLLLHVMECAECKKHYKFDGVTVQWSFKPGTKNLYCGGDLWELGIVFKKVDFDKSKLSKHVYGCVVCGHHATYETITQEDYMEELRLQEEGSRETKEVHIMLR